ncbi:cysteine peptidase family C39 domain-containing protein [Tenacibaculum tangerinum]|uniref:Cysteine peptidase family C39 domain-containing protein n=1 Tax=Tenacibaculum tangerinum TaxID=3038772 RepID=A0ABY8L3T3_9FLAO|nr:cysteine peptidase family C39 domain-containing protein [Tenacibaculum tangerinum]WGH74669.1 cysteine peptidase family C39 domain-containing protein [Tenacibaculum tangerinum]
MKQALNNSVQRLLKNNSISFDKEELDFQIQSHPSYPSLHAITGVLDYFNIENIAADVPVNNSTLIQLPDCFLAQINTDKGKDLVVVQRSKLAYFVYDANHKKEKYSEEKFLEIFTGIIVAVEKDEEKIVIERKSNFIKPIIFSLLIGLMGIVLYQNTIHLYTLT